MRTIRFFAAIMVLVAIALPSAGQQSAQLVPDQSAIKIKGTSNLHEWEEEVGKFKVNLNLKINENKLTSIDHVHVTMQSGSIHSSNNIMTNKTHDALNVKKYPEIEFKFVSVDKLSSSGGKFSGTLVGDITIAGVTKRISLAFSGVHTGNKVTINGTKELNMNDFKIDPPTALMGTLKTGQEVTISFSLNFQVT